ncbi:hypothetical protein ACIRPS_18080 [Streptomyces griseoviridis]
MTITQPVSLNKNNHSAAGPDLAERAENLAERAFLLALELDTVKAELAEADAELADMESAEIGWIKAAMGLMVERDLWKLLALELERKLAAAVLS